MQRHFSNRGEALAEVTAARMLAAKRRKGKLGFVSQPARGVSRQKWFPERLENPRMPRKPRIQPGSEESGIQR